jgi:hypothetical protein
VAAAVLIGSILFPAGSRRAHDVIKSAFPAANEGNHGREWKEDVLVGLSESRRKLLAVVDSVGKAMNAYRMVRRNKTTCVIPCFQYPPLKRVEVGVDCDSASNSI